MKQKKWTSQVRKFLHRESEHFVVRVTCGDTPPTMHGRAGGFYTRGGTPIAYPSAYARVGWSNMQYCCSTLECKVGIDWLARNMPDAYAQVVAERHAIRVYIFDPVNPPERARLIEKLQEGACTQ